MIKLIVSIILAFLLSAGVSNMEILLQNDKRSFKDFDEISVCGSIEVELIQADRNEAEIRVKNAELEELEMKIKGDLLQIKWKNKKWGWGKHQNRKANITLHYKELEAVYACAGSYVNSDDVVQSSSFEVEVSSGAEVELNIKCEELDIDISSGATVELEGSSDEQKIRANSGATYKGKELHTKNSDIKVNSGASAKVYVTEKLKAKAHSGGSVKYYGDPKNFEIDTGISGSVKKH